MTVKIIAAAAAMLMLCGCGDGKSKAQHLASCTMTSDYELRIITCMAAAGYVYDFKAEQGLCPILAKRCYWDENAAAVKDFVKNPKSTIGSWIGE